MKIDQGTILSVLPAKISPAGHIVRVEPRLECDIKNCECRMSIGMFFDGTNNNMDRDFPSRAHTNIARLHESYRGDQAQGSYRVYIPGVGTRFPEIGEVGGSTLGAACAFGCEGRVIYGLLAILNLLHHHCFSENMFSSKEVLALCRNGSHVSGDADIEHLSKVGEERGLLEPEIGLGNRLAFLTRQCRILQNKLKTSKPRVLECFIDVFGFSRGAAEARVFCSWLNELLVNGCLAGVLVRFRFVGIIDTVASAGFWSGAIAFATKSTGGHGAWASVEALRLPSAVQNCVHMVAMHELRRNFPLDVIGVGGKIRKGWLQYAYPGSHSDVGGGYRPGELGVAVGDDSQKLSQIPLNHMLECAQAAGVPINKADVRADVYDPFAIHPELAKAYDNFITQATLSPRPIYDWLQPYLNWRWQVRERYHLTNQVTRANKEDREVLLSHNRKLISDAGVMAQQNKNRSFGQLTQTAMKSLFMSRERADAMRSTSLEPEARSIFAIAQNSKPTPPSFAKLFDEYVHDSLAGFNSPVLESPGHWRYRRVYLGTDEHTIASAHDIDAAMNIA